MINQPTEVQAAPILPVHFSDVGDLGRALGWDMGFRQLDPGPQSIPARVLLGEHVAVLRMNLNRGYHQCAYPPPGSITCGVPETGAVDWFSSPYPDQCILPFNQASGIDVVSRPGFLAYTVSFSEAFLHEVSETLQLPLPDILYKPASGALIPDSQAVQNIRSYIRSAFRRNPQAIDVEQETELAIEFLHAGVGEAANTESIAPIVRRKAVEQALDYIHQCQREGEVITVGELCTVTDIPWRTLTRAFQERFGLGPKAYLNRLRLSHVRILLSTGSGKVVIADAANSQGFWHMGQFARDYRRVFGELPSDTLKRSVR